MMKILSKEMFKREFGTKQKRTLFGKEIMKISPPKKRLVRRLIRSGRRLPSCLFPKLEKWKIMTKFRGPKIIGRVEDWHVMDGNSQSLRVKSEEGILRITRLKL
jgi:hypothetical protein